MRCPHCESETPSALECVLCQKVLPATSQDAFDLLALPHKWVVTPQEVTQAFHQQSRVFHPDRFFNKTPLERRIALERTTDLTQAYKHLRDVLAKARYYLAVAGHSLSENTTLRDARILHEVMEAREQIAELFEKPRTEALNELKRLQQTYENKVLVIKQHLGQLFVRADAGASPTELTGELYSLLAEEKYWQGILEAVQQTSVRLATNFPNQTAVN